MLVQVVLLLAGTPQPARADEVGLLRVAHLSPDTPAVDVTITPLGSSAPGVPLTDMGYGTVSPWHRLTPGSYAVALRAAGASPTTAPVPSARVEVPAGAARTVAATGRFADLSLRVADDDLSAPPAGRAGVRVVSAATAGPVDVTTSEGRVLAAALPFPDVGARSDVPGGTSTVAVAAGGAPAQQVPVDLPAGSVTSLLVLDRPGGGLTVQPVLDAGGPSVVPVGPVPAGGGGTAGGSSTVRLVAALICGMAGAALLATFRPRRRA